MDTIPINTGPQVTINYDFWFSPPQNRSLGSIWNQQKYTGLNFEASQVEAQILQVSYPKSISMYLPAPLQDGLKNPLKMERNHSYK